MRIIGGKFRGRVLTSPKGEQTRPTSSLLRKAFFDICAGDLEGANFLDLFAGSGAVGLEALSRGAEHATFVDKSPLACKAIAQNINLLGVEGQSTVLCMPVERALKSLQKKNQSFSLIYIDPPYGQENIASLLKQIHEAHLADTTTRVFVEESSKQENLEDLSPSVQCIEKRRYGDTFLVQYRFC